MNDVYRFGPFRLDPSQRSLARDGADVAVTPKAFDILLYLVEHPNRVVTKQDLMKAVWPDTIVEEGNLTQNLSLLRKALGDETRLIVTVARQGYQFTADVTVEAPPPPRPETRWRNFAVLGTAALLVFIGASIAWQRFRNAPDPENVRLAVLPFENLTGDVTQEYLADGLTEELIAQLARLQPDRLGVIARTSVMQYKHTTKRIDEIGRDLSVRYALESSLRRSADRLRVTVQLIRVQDQSHIWANDFDYASQDILRFEDEVAAAVAHEVQIQVTPVGRARATRSASTKPEAVDAFLRGRDIVQYGKGTKDDWTNAKRYFDQAIALDSSYALPWVWLSDIARKGADRGFMSVEDGDREARQAAQRAVVLDPNLPEAYNQLGKIQRLIDWDWVGANASYQRELELDPGNADAYAFSGMVAMYLGHIDQGIALAQRARALDPLNPGAIGALGEALYKAGRLDESAKIFEDDSSALRSPVLDEKLVEIYLARGRVNDAMTVANRIASPPWQGIARELVYVHQGQRHTADSVLTDYVKRYGAFASYQIAQMYAYRNEKDSAFVWLDRAYGQHDQGLDDAKVDPQLANLRGDPRYGALLIKLKLPP
jgi:TolB-like protein/DNA-binding winged helix-turn-helix (wHTH) protein/Tfp pilus assembly protein PilF